VPAKDGPYSRMPSSVWLRTKPGFMRRPTRATVSVREG
jgi:hypothetical protein